MEEKRSIRNVSEAYGVSARTLRFYEEAGILTCHRAAGSGYREYDKDQIQRLELILLLRKLSFTLEEIAGLLNGDARLREAFRRKLKQSDVKLLELRETNRLLHRLDKELFNKPRGDINASDILGELIYLTKQTERMLPMKQEQDRHLILLGEELIPVVTDLSIDLVSKIKALREAKPALPVIRIKDDLQLNKTEAVIIWDGEEAWRGDCGGDPVKAAELLIGKVGAML